MMKAKTALTLGKAYRQDQALEWGLLTEEEVSHRGRRRAGAASETHDPPAPAGRPDEGGDPS
jgi:hypothetical protein